MNSYDTAARAVNSLAARLAALDTDTPAMTGEELQALYLRAAQKAGVTPAADAAFMPAAAAGKCKKPPIRWQRWALSAAAVLLVMAAGGAGLVLNGGFGASSADKAEFQMMDAAAPEMALAEETAPEDAKPETPAEAPENGAVTGGSSSINYSYAGTGEADGSAEKDTGRGLCSGLPRAEETDGAREELADAAAADWPAALMLDGVIYLMESTPMAGEVDESAIIGYTVGYTDTWPDTDWQTNFHREGGLTLARVEGGIAVLYEGEWYLCTATK